MKHFDLPWDDLIDALPAWGELDLTARRRLLDTLKPSGAVAAEGLGEQLDALRASGLVETTGTRAFVTESMRPFVRALRAMDRHAELLREPTLERLTRYLEEHFTAEELHALQGGAGRGWGHAYVDRRAVAREVCSVGWVEEFLTLSEIRTAQVWEEGHRHRDQLPLLHRQDAFDAAQRLVDSLVAHPDGLPLRDLLAAVPGARGAQLGGALHAALRYLLVFAVLDPETLEPRVGIWPPVARRMAEPPPPPPQPVEPVETFHLAMTMEDMTAVLVAASGEPLRLRGADMRIFARQQQAIAERLVSLPHWVVEGLGLDSAARVPAAALLLQRFGLARSVGSAGEDLRLEATREGSSWLALSDRDRLAALLDPIRGSEARNPPAGWYRREDGPLEFFPVHLSIDLPKKGYDLRAVLTDALLSLPADTFVAWTAFVKYHRRERNPFLQRKEERATARQPGFGLRHVGGREAWEELWARVVEEFLVFRLALLGGARVGRLADGTIAFALTDVGRYLLGAADEFRYGHDAAADVIVQPNFEIVFLAPSPKVEAQLARFAERAGAGPGVMFRLTRESVLAAAEAGLGAATVLDTLRRVSARDLPPNVERQVDDWLGSVRRVSLHPTVLVRCPDADTALRARAAAGDSLLPLTETVLQLADPSARAKKALLARLRKQGIFVK